jgi:cell division protease FtsH
MFENIVVALGGRIAEKLFLDDISTGASGDIQQATGLARDMVMRYGMSERLGPILYDSSGHSIFIGRDFGQMKSYSEETAGIIDEEVKAIFDLATERCEGILKEHEEQLRGLAEYLLVHETIEADEFNYYFEHGEFMPESLKAGKKARSDKTIERPARKISMIDGYADEAAAESAIFAAEEEAAAQDAAAEAEEESAEAGVQSSETENEGGEQKEEQEPAPQTEPPQEENKD